MYTHSKRNFSRPAHTRGTFRPRFSRPQKFFDPSLFVRKAEAPVEQAVFQPVHQFTDFAISDALKQNISIHGYTAPTPIQDQAIPAILEGRDVVGLANTGTGKTAAFLLPLINKIYTYRDQKVLIIAPTRELAVQIQDEFKAFARGLKIYSTLCIGGVGINGQIYNLERNPHFVIGTPGRLKDLERQGVLRFSQFHNIVLDEVDRMLDMGFITDISYIIQKLPHERQSLFFSATMPPKVEAVMRGFLRNPVTVSVKSREAAANVDQDIIQLAGRSKADVLEELLKQEGWNKVLVFGRTKHGMEKLSKVLFKRGFQVAAIHGNKSQNQRQRAIEQFKNDKIQVLVATDIASRGLDISNVTHVVNYDLPESPADYIHRIGRTGRADKKGSAVTFIE